jgi:hypothetical protein
LPRRALRSSATKDLWSSSSSHSTDRAGSLKSRGHRNAGLDSSHWRTYV